MPGWLAAALSGEGAWLDDKALAPIGTKPSWGGGLGRDKMSAGGVSDAERVGAAPSPVTRRLITFSPPEINTWIGGS